MKLLILGDFHGKFPAKFKKIIKDEKIDLVVSLGDYPPFHYRKLWFKHCYGKDIELGEVIGKKKYKELVLEDLRRAENALKKLNDLPVPVYTVLGNMDYPAANDIKDGEEELAKFLPNYDKGDALVKRMKKYKNIHRFDYRAMKFENYVFIGMRGHSAPGWVKSKAFKKHREKLNKLFKKYKKENKEGKIIFISHNIAHDTNLDKLSMKAIRFAMKNAGRKFKKVIAERKRHYGSKMARRIINSFQPILHFGGHIHEARGKQKLGRTLCINPGAAHEGHGAIVELEKGKVKKSKLI